MHSSPGTPSGTGVSASFSTYSCTWSAGAPIGTLDPPDAPAVVRRDWILHGLADDWTPAEPCRKLTEAAKSAGYAVDVKVYPGAHHAFDSMAPVRYVAERINPNAQTGKGATTGGGAEAWADAIDEVARFLATHLK